MATLVMQFQVDEFSNPVMYCDAEENDGDDQEPAMKRISFEDLVRNRRLPAYDQQYAYIMELLEAGRIKPLLASGKNGKKPALYREYWLIEEKADTAGLEEELKYQLIPAISIDYYLKHLKTYREERPWVLMLNAYLRDERGKLRHGESVNERSFEIWNREKFLSREQGKRILKHCGLEPEALNMFETSEPMAYYSHTRKVPQNLLILENKDTFYSMRRQLLKQSERAGKQPDEFGVLLGTEIGTLIYGAGKGILRSFQDFSLCVEPYMTDKRNRIYYFGDLDYEGIGIYENLAKLCQEHQEIIPFQPAYQEMLEKAAGVKALPDTKERQNRNIGHLFFDWFPEETVSRMKQILSEGKYIPQEILNILDFM